MSTKGTGLIGIDRWNFQSRNSLCEIQENYELILNTLWKFNGNKGITIVKNIYCSAVKVVNTKPVTQNKPSFLFS